MICLRMSLSKGFINYVKNEKYTLFKRKFYNQSEILSLPEDVLNYLKEQTTIILPKRYDVFYFFFFYKLKKL